MSVQTVARRYAAALADVTIPRGEARDVQTELQAWEEIMTANPMLLEVFRNPTIPYEQKRSVLAALIERARVSKTTANFLNVLLRNQRLPELAEVNRKFAQVLDDRSGVVAAQVMTARPVDDGTKAAVEQKLSSVTGKRVRLSFSTDDSIIGGIVTRVGSTVFDGSIRTQLERAKQQLGGK